MDGILDHLKQNNLKKLTNGKGGADVYQADNDFVLKNVIREKVQDNTFAMYEKESDLYQAKKGDTGYLPEIMINGHSDQEIVILMKRYDQPDKNNIDDALLSRIARAIALVHADEIPDFLKQENAETALLTGEEIKDASDGWLSILEEHPGEFDAGQILKASGQINDIITWHDTEEKVLLHGDFHWDNLLLSSTGDILLCDWQGVKVGGVSEDLSFFLSRLKADGVSIDEDRFLNLYRDAFREITGREVDTASIRRHMQAADFITAFRFWHLYLHGSDGAVVKSIFDKICTLQTI